MAHSAIVMKLASRSITAAVTVMVPNSLGPAKLLLHYGTKAQRDHYLPRLARGDEIPCFALTGPQPGSDASAIPDRGVVRFGEWKGWRMLVECLAEGRGISLGPSDLIGRAYQSVPIAITVEGANILTRSMIIFGQGAVRCHPWVLKELTAAARRTSPGS